LREIIIVSNSSYIWYTLEEDLDKKWCTAYISAPANSIKRKAIIKAIGKNVFKTIPKADRKEVIAEMMKQRDMLQNAIKGNEGQLLHKNDEYEGAALKVYRFLYNRFKDEDISPATSYEMPTVKEGEPSA